MESAGASKPAPSYGDCLGEDVAVGQLRILEKVAGGAPLGEILEDCIRLCESQAPGMIGSILVVDADGERLRHGAGHGLPAEYKTAIDGAPIGPGTGSCGTAAYRAEPVFVEDIASDPLWKDYCGFALPHGLKACWSTPILGARGRVLGTFAMYYRKPGLPTPRHLELIGMVTHLASIAISRWRADLEQRQIFARISDAFVALDRHWRYTFVNEKAGQFFSRTPESLLGKNIWTEFPEGVGQKFHLAYERAMREQVPLQIEEYYPPFDKWFENRIFPTPEGLSIYFLDITERKKREEVQRQSEKLAAIGLLAGGIAHDFNNQLSIILGYADLLVSRLQDPDLRRYAGSVQSAARSSGELTRNLLTFSRRGHFESGPLDFHDLATEVAGLLRHTMGKGVEVRCRFEAGRAVVLGDPASLQNALLNLALNARDAMPKGGTLEIATSEEQAGLPGPAADGTIAAAPASSPADAAAEGAPLAPGTYLSIRVTDTGTGMTEDVRKRIFEPFFTTKSGMVGASGRAGTGLGLASVFGTVKIHKGRITVESAPERGTTFRILLPLAPAGSGVAPGGDAPVPAPRSLSVLVVEDDARIRSLLEAMLASDGHRVIHAGSGHEALVRFAERRGAVDLVLLDMAMPDMEGGEIFRALQGVDAGVRVLLTSGVSAEGRVWALLEQGALGHLQKPYDQPRLSRMISQAMAAP